MQVQLLVERDQNECIVKLAGTAYKFKRNEYGHLVSEITDHDDIRWVSDPHHNTAFKAYSAPKKITEEVVHHEAVVGVEVVAEEVVVTAGEPEPGDVTATESKRPSFPQKGSKRPVARSNR